MTGYRRIRSWWKNHSIPGIRHQGGGLFLCGRAICDVAPSAQIFLQSDLVLGANLRRGSNAESYLKIRERGTLEVRDRFQVFFGASLEIWEDAHLTLGKGYINTGAAIACAKSVTLGNGVFIARDVYITDSDHHKILDAEGRCINQPEPIVIGDHVLIGYGATVLKGVTIGNGAVVAAGSVVTKDVPAGCMVAGVPAKVVREGVLWK